MPRPLSSGSARCGSGSYSSQVLKVLLAPGGAGIPAGMLKTGLRLPIGGVAARFATLSGLEFPSSCTFCGCISDGRAAGTVASFSMTLTFIGSGPCSLCRSLMSRCRCSSVHVTPAATATPTFTSVCGCGLPHARSSADARSRNSATVATSSAPFLAARVAVLAIACSIDVDAESSNSSRDAANASAIGCSPSSFRELLRLAPVRFQRF